MSKQEKKQDVKTKTTSWIRTLSWHDFCENNIHPSKEQIEQAKRKLCEFNMQEWVQKEDIQKLKETLGQWKAYHLKKVDRLEAKLEQAEAHVESLQQIIQWRAEEITELKKRLDEAQKWVKHFGDVITLDMDENSNYKGLKPVISKTSYGGISVSDYCDNYSIEVDDVRWISQKKLEKELAKLRVALNIEEKSEGSPSKQLLRTCLSHREAEK